MPILSSYILPHPPLIVPEIGKGEERKILKTIEAYEEVSKKIAELAPDTIVFITPHSVSYSDYLHISHGLVAEGDFAQFGLPELSFGVMYEKKLVSDITKLCEEHGLAAGNQGGNEEAQQKLDHGFLVPLYFIHKYFQDFRCVRISISSLPFLDHYRLGTFLTQVCELFNRNAVIIASGDLSHKLTLDGPYGYAEEGPIFDEKIIKIIQDGNMDEFLNFTEQECQSAAECGLRAFIIMAGALDGKKIKSRLLSYEGPLGVGYAVAEFLIQEQEESPHVKLARETLETYVKTGKIIRPDDDTAQELIDNKAGVFVSLKKFGQLRGCIGTIAPTKKNIALEIIANAISAGTEDCRFLPVTEQELSELTYSVDILQAAEKITDKSQLNVKEYGVIVTNGMRRGLLLPNLEGIDTVEEQIEIALQKANILPSKGYEMERFKVTRFY